MLPGYAGRLHGRIAVSAAARHFVDRFFPGDYKVIPNGVDVGRFQRAVPISRWQDGTPNILFVGRLEDRKGLPHLLKAFRLIRKSGVEARLLVVGTGPQEREARRYVMTRGLQNVEFLGRVSDDDKAQLFRTADRLRLAGHRTRVVRHRPAGGHGRRRADRLQRHPRLQGRGPAGPPGAPGPAAATIRALSAAIERSARAIPELRARLSAAGPAARRAVRLGARDRQGRGLLRLRDQAAGGPGPASAGLLGRGSARAAPRLGSRPQPASEAVSVRAAPRGPLRRAGGGDSRSTIRLVQAA